MCKEHRFTQADAFFMPICSMLEILSVNLAEIRIYTI
jgi:hypothetical protein